MENNNENRSKTLLTRLKPAEYQSFYSAFKKTRFNSLSEYSRSLLLSRPVVVYYRDKSMDDMLEELAVLRRELNAIGNNLNQAVRLIHIAHGQVDSKIWISLFSVIRSKIHPSINQIKDQMQIFSDQWLQKSKLAETSTGQ